MENIITVGPHNSNFHGIELTLPEHHTILTDEACLVLLPKYYGCCKYQKFAQSSKLNVSNGFQSSSKNSQCYICIAAKLYLKPCNTLVRPGRKLTNKLSDYFLSDLR